MARRLVERGVRFVQVYSGGGHLDENWDAHSDVQANHALHCGETDQPIAALLTDLKRRGSAGRDAGRVGRRVRPHADLARRSKGGRDHSPRGFSMWMAGGGIKGGVAYGATDDFGLRGGRKQSPRPRHSRHDPAPDGARSRAADLFPQRPRNASDRRRGASHPGHSGVSGCGLQFCLAGIGRSWLATERARRRKMVGCHG